jgi:hypothetical protein
MCASLVINRVAQSIISVRMLVSLLLTPYILVRAGLIVSTSNCSYCLLMSSASSLLTLAALDRLLSVWLGG